MSEQGTRARVDHFISVRVTAELYQQIQRDADQLGVSLADAMRMRLRTGRVPVVVDQPTPSHLGA